MAGRGRLIALAVALAVVAGAWWRSRPASVDRDRSRPRAIRQPPSVRPAAPAPRPELPATARSGEEAQLAGIVVDVEGRPLPAVTVAVVWLGWTPDRPSTDEREAVTDAQGRYRIHGLAPGTWQLGGSSAHARVRPRQVALVAGETGDGDLIADPGALVSGRVVVRSADGTTQPCSQGWVQLVTEREPTRVGVGLEADGTFAIGGVRLTTWEVRVRCQGYASAARYSPLVVDGDVARAYEVTPGGIIAGVVRAVDRSPVAGARIELAAGVPASTTADDGTFAIHGVPAGVYAVGAVIARRRGRVVVTDVAVAEDGRAWVELVAPANTGTLDGVVLDLRGQPVADVQLGITSGGGGWAFGGASGADGRFTIRKVEEGTQWVRVLRGPPQATPPGPATDGALVLEQAQVTMAPGGRARVTLRLASVAVRGSITGLVLDARGAPVPGLTVGAQCEPGADGETAGVWWHRVGSAADATDDDGHFAIEDLGPGRCRVVASDPAAGQAELDEVEPGTDVLLRLDGVAAE